MREAVEQCGGHFGVAEDAGPLSEGKIGRDDDRGALVEAADQMEQQLSAGLGEQRRTARNPALENLKILYRFSAMGVAAVTLIVVSGTINAGFRVAGSFGKLFDTAYGDVLCAKLALVALMLALAFFNRFVAMPRSRGASGECAAQTSTLTRNVATELALSILVLGATAVLGITPPPQ